MFHNKAKLYMWLFGINLFISSFTFGGGYVVVPMIRKYFVQKKKLFSEEDVVNMAAVAQSTPGAIAINLSALAGYRCAGVAGTVISCVAALLPPLLILSVISVGYSAFCSNVVIAAVLRGMQAGVAALIVDLVADMCMMIIRKKSKLLTFMMPFAFVGSFVLGINVAVILFICCGLCIGQMYKVNWRAERE